MVLLPCEPIRLECCTDKDLKARVQRFKCFFDFTKSLHRSTPQFIKNGVEEEILSQLLINFQSLPLPQMPLSNTPRQVKPLN